MFVTLISSGSNYTNLLTLFEHQYLNDCIEQYETFKSKSCYILRAGNKAQ